MLQMVRPGFVYGRTTGPLSLKVLMLKAEKIETAVLCVTWAYSAQHFARLRSAHQVLLRVIGFQRPQRADYTSLSYTRTLKKT